jgi:ABC-type spermidine/putrescine transport system permease subunit I
MLEVVGFSKASSMFLNPCCIFFVPLFASVKEKYITRYTDKRFNKFIDQFFYRYTVLFLGYSIKIAIVSLLIAFFIPSGNDGMSFISI